VDAAGDAQQAYGYCGRELDLPADVEMGKQENLVCRGFQADGSVRHH